MTWLVWVLWVAIEINSHLKVDGLCPSLFDSVLAPIVHTDDIVYVWKVLNAIILWMYLSTLQNTCSWNMWLLKGTAICFTYLSAHFSDSRGVPIWIKWTIVVSIIQIVYACGKRGINVSLNWAFLKKTGDSTPDVLTEIEREFNDKILSQHMNHYGDNLQDFAQKKERLRLECNVTKNYAKEDRDEEEKEKSKFQISEISNVFVASAIALKIYHTLHRYAPIPMVTVGIFDIPSPVLMCPVQNIYVFILHGFISFLCTNVVDYLDMEVWDITFVCTLSLQLYMPLLSFKQQKCLWESMFRYCRSILSVRIIIRWTVISIIIGVTTLIFYYLDTNDCVVLVCMACVTYISLACTRNI